MKLSFIAILFVFGTISCQLAPAELCVSNLKQGLTLVKTIKKDLDEKSNFKLMADFMSGSSLVMKTYESCTSFTKADLLAYLASKMNQEQKECLVSVLSFSQIAKTEADALKNKKFSTFFAGIPELLYVTNNAVMACPASINF